jgi:purine-nucleoside phosphorylase
MATAHINAASGDYADTVLMPGDPVRAQYIAENFLDDARRVNDVRNMWGFTGAYRGQPVSVQAHGMGIPSASIYTEELIKHFGVKRVIRVGSCGTTHPDVQLRDIVIAMGAADLFYTPDTDMFETMAKYNVYGIEMEAAGIFPIAAENDAEALAICTVSDDIPSGKHLTSEERATTFDEMIGIALDTVVAEGR